MELCLWTDETKIILNLSDGKAKVWREKGTTNNPKHTASSVKHGGGGILAWACIAASGTGSLNFTDDSMYDDSSRMNLDGYKHEFHQLKRRVKAETLQNKQQLELAALKAGESILKNETKRVWSCLCVTDSLL